MKERNLEDRRPRNASEPTGRPPGFRPRPIITMTMAVMLVVPSSAETQQSTGDSVFTIDLAAARSLHKVENAHVRAPVRIEVVNINPFSGVYVLQVSNLQALEAPSDVGASLVQFLEPFFPPLVEAFRVLATVDRSGPATLTAPILVPEGGAPCTNVPPVAATAALMEGTSRRLDEGLREAREGQSAEHSLSTSWADLQSLTGNSGDVKTRAQSVLTEAQTVLTAKRQARDNIERLAAEAKALAAQLQALAPAYRAAGCDSEEIALAIGILGRLGAVEALIQRENAAIQVVELLRETLLQVNERDYVAATLIPLQTGTGQVDVTLIRRRPNDPATAAAQLVASRRIRFERRTNASIALGLGGVLADLRIADYEAREISVPGGSSGEAVAGYEVAMTNRTGPKFALAVVGDLTFGGRDWIGAVIGVGSQLGDTRKPSLLVGPSFSFSGIPIRIILPLSFTSSSSLREGLRVGDPLARATDLRVDGVAAIGFGVGLSWMLR